MSESRIPLTGWVPFPNVLLDKFMPRLTDTEWRVLCVVVRQTFGWKDERTGRKQFDRLSHFQLKRKTGRQSAAVSRAIDTLVRSGLIVIQDQMGQSLASSTERRLSHSHLWFGLGPSLTSAETQMSVIRALRRNSKSKDNKTKDN